MIPIISCPLPGGGTALIRTSDIGGATTGQNPKHTDLYVLGWASQGITVDLRIEDFAEIWVSALFDEPQGHQEYDIVFTPDEVH